MSDSKKIEQAISQQTGIKGEPARDLVQAAKEMQRTGESKGLTQALKATAQNALQQAGINKSGQELGKKGHELNGNEQQKVKARETLSHAM
jgi:hypothetical protein